MRLKNKSEAVYAYKIACSNNVPINTGGWLFHLYICSNIKVTSYKHHAQCGCSFIGRKSFFIEPLMEIDGDIKPPLICYLFAMTSCF